MSFVQDSDNRFVLLLFSACVVLSAFVVLSGIAAKAERTEGAKGVGGAESAERIGSTTGLRYCRVSALTRILLCISCSECIMLAEGILWQDTGRLLLLCIIFACMLAACVMDVETRMIYDYVWWIAGGGAVLLLCTTCTNYGLPAELIIFVLLQEFLFAKMYGRADCHAFSVCAVTEGAYGMGMKEYLLHMLFAYILLAFIQLWKGNVGRDGNLKEPIPFLPYITVTFAGMLFYTN